MVSFPPFDKYQWILNTGIFLVIWTFVELRTGMHRLWKYHRDFLTKISFWSTTRIVFHTFFCSFFEKCKFHCLLKSIKSMIIKCALKFIAKRVSYMFILEVSTICVHSYTRVFSLQEKISLFLPFFSLYLFARSSFILRLHRHRCRVFDINYERLQLNNRIHLCICSRSHSARDDE